MAPHGAPFPKMSWLFRISFGGRCGLVSLDHQNHLSNEKSLVVRVYTTPPKFKIALKNGGWKTTFLLGR